MDELAQFAGRYWLEAVSGSLRLEADGMKGGEIGCGECGIYRGRKPKNKI
ncbi:hypothetical protein [Bittarella massiliensis (ex Durand et al. 2017)]|uniref:Uncharacterized protein n=1 Tax=Bittarella massiliensis (ex Durand et al. 2017) TaxID=1720313 RepID=A0ABW9WW83_9FIRM|nr:hypothetical protein [Bittarella massiliensis (ex Durand et al. 2017)]MZL69729.1 hypothetical protein [Bittarella massiliensis (ex Durand et al. 2017)]MZL80799.1 hypothetical protein [Bittarella massiliensis (ex Durand et al. 2017)]